MSQSFEMVSEESVSNTECFAENDVASTFVPDKQEELRTSKRCRDSFWRVNIAVFPLAITHLVSQRNEGNLVVGESLFTCFQICLQTKKRAQEWIAKIR